MFRIYFFFAAAKEKVAKRKGVAADHCRNARVNRNVSCRYETFRVSSRGGRASMRALILCNLFVNIKLF